MTPVVLYRSGLADPAEELECAAHFPVYRYRAQVPAGSLVIGRYSLLPFYNEMEADINLLGSRLINSLAQHRYIADFQYYEDLKDVTFPSWTRLEDVPFRLRSQPFVVKGRTNSRKFEWHRKMFAKDFAAAVGIAADLATDGLIGQQGVVVRQYVPLETFEEGVTGTPLTNEWRIFYYRGERLAWGYYWGILDDWSHVERATPDFERSGLPFADAVAQRLVDKAPFVVLDIAKTQEGQWQVVELNDGCQAGLNGTVKPFELYGALAKALNR